MSLAHNQTLLKFFLLLNAKPGMDVIQIGKDLVAKGADKLSDGGFWIWDIVNRIEYYSPMFYTSLGYKDQSEPYVPETWQKWITPEGLNVANENFEKHLAQGEDHPYHQEVEYFTKAGGKINLVCSGSLVKVNGEPVALIGTHKLL